MGRYSDVEWAGKTVQQSINCLLVMTENAWDYQITTWPPVAKAFEDLCIQPLVHAYNAVADAHQLPKYSGNTFVGGLIAGRVGGKDRDFVLKETAIISATFNNAMQYMAQNEGWSAAQEGMEKACLQRLENLIRFVRGFESSSAEVRYLEKNPEVAA